MVDGGMGEQAGPSTGLQHVLTLPLTVVGTHGVARAVGYTGMGCREEACTMRQSQAQKDI